MSFKKYSLLAIIFMMVGVLVPGATILALNGKQHEQRPAGMISEQQKQIVTERKAALEQKLTAAKDARQNKLEGKRLATCEQRQAKINSILSRGTDQSRKHLAVFQKIEERVKQFYANKNLSSENYDAAVANVDEKEALALAAIEASTETTFECNGVDGAKPGEAIKDLMKTRHQALKDYRTAIKDLILVVKKANSEE